MGLEAGNVRDHSAQALRPLAHPPWRALLHYAVQVRSAFLGSLVLLLLVSALTAAKAWIIQPAVDGFRQRSVSREELILLCAVICALFLLQAGCTFGYSLISRMAGARIVLALREDLFAHLLCQGWRYCAGHRSSDLNSRSMNDVAAFEAALTDSLQGLIRDGLTLLFLFGVMLYHDLSLTGLCLMMIAAIGILLAWLNRSIRSLSSQVQERLSAISQQFLEMLAGLEVVLTFGLAEPWQRRFKALNVDHYRVLLRLEGLSFFTGALVKALMGIALAAVLFVTGRALLRGEITEGEFLSLLGTLYLMQAPAIGIGQKAARVSRGVAAGRRAFEILDDAPDLDEPLEPLSLGEGDLGFSLCDVTFALAGRPILREVSFEVAPGTLVALTGHSGAGKTTLARLLLRFDVPQRGTVLFGAIPLARLSRRELSRAVSYVSQEVFLLDESLRMNLTLGKAEVSDAEIAAVLRTCCLDDVLADLPRGLDTPVGERGGKLSGGQRQRIAIARALLAAPRVLILDEATSALDETLEHRLLGNLLEGRRSATILAITHRPGVAAMADRILVLEEGRLVSDRPGGRSAV